MTQLSGKRFVHRKKHKRLNCLQNILNEKSICNLKVIAPNAIDEVSEKLHVCFESNYAMAESFLGIRGCSDSLFHLPFFILQQRNVITGL